MENHYIKGSWNIPRKDIMASSYTCKAPSPRQTLDGQGVLRIPASQARNHPKVETYREKNINTLKKGNTPLKIGTWNARSLYAAGKTHNIIAEMKRMSVNVLGVSEVRWPGTGKINMENHTMYYSGNDDPQHYNGVAIIIDNKNNKSVKSFVPLSDRVALLQLKAHPRDINIVQVYAPTTESHENDILRFYSEIKQLLKLTKKNEVNIIMGDLNAKVGEGRVDGIIGNWGLGERNERGDLLVEFCQEENFVVTNTCFKLPKRRLYTWRSPGDTKTNIIRNQIDYILIDKRYRNGISNVKTYPGADVGSDHSPVVGTIFIRLKKIKHHIQRRPDFEKLRHPEICTEITEQLNVAIKRTITQQEQPIEESWSSLEHAINQIQAEKLSKEPTAAKKPWMSNEILELMETRRKYKNINIDKYKETQTNIQKLIRHAKEKWMNDRCQELEELQKKHDQFNIYKKVKEITGIRKKALQTNFLKTENGEIITDQEEIKEEWSRYIREMFDDERTEPELERDNDLTLNILPSEVNAAIKTAKSGKAAGPDNVYTEMLKLLDQENLQRLTDLFNKIYSSGTYPRDWLKSVFIPIPKKNTSRKCSDFRLISLMSNTLKIMLKILHRRIYLKCEQNISPEQFGFRLGLGTREALFGLTVLLQKCRDQRKDVYMCFIDYEKAFDRIKHPTLLQLLQKQGLDYEDIRLIKNLYWEQRGFVRFGDTVSSEIPIRRGVRQGCVLSPLLFNIYSEYIFQQALEDCEIGIKVNGKILNNIRYADDTVIFADTSEGLQELVDKIVKSGDQHGLKINTAKTKTMVVSRNQNLQANIRIYGTSIEEVRKFRYLGCWVTQDLDPETEIRARIENARATFVRMKTFLTNTTLSLDARYRFVKSYIYSVLLYGTESWTMGKRIMQRLEAFEMWIFRRLLKIPWTRRITNENVLRMMGTDRELLQHVKQRKTGYLGHVYRGEKYQLLRLLMEGKIEGRRGLGRRKCSWLKNIREWTGLDTCTLLRAARNREEFAGIVANLQ